MKTFASLVGIGMALALGAAPRPALAEAANPTPDLAQPAVGQASPVPPAAPAPGARDGWLQGRAAARLGLTEAQKASCQAIIEKHRPSLEQKRQAALEARRAYWEAARKPDTAPDTLRQLHRTLSDQTFEAQLERRALHQELRAQLTPEQRERAAWMEGRMAARMEARGGAGCAPMGRVRHEFRPMPPVAPAP